MPRTVAGCGTEAAYKRHVSHGEPVDEACAAAHLDYARAYRDEQRRRRAQQIAHARSLTGDALRVECARMDAAGYSTGQIGITFGLMLEGVRGAVVMGRQIIVAARRTRVTS